MKRIVVLIFCLSLSLSNLYSQKSADDKNVSKNYSESVSYKPTEFPGNKNKKEKKRKSNPAKEKNADVLEVKRSVFVPVTVVNEQNTVVADLKPSDFQLFVDDRQITDFSVENLEENLNIILLLDTSPSAEFKIKDLQDYAVAFVESLKPQDKVMVADFNGNLKIRNEFTNDRQIIKKAISKTRIGGGTSLYDVIEKVFKQKIANMGGRTALVLVTDGVDTTSRDSDYEKSLETVERYDVPVFVVYLDTFGHVSNFPKNNRIPLVILGQMGQIMKPQNVDAFKIDYERGKYYLNDLVSLSGGRVSLFENISNSQNIVLPKFAEELRLKYYLKFTPPKTAESGSRKQIKVRVNRPNLFLLAKGSYIAN
ncbi:MAG TPA: VWA domain-containing protein [Pyrinomonadaceae bacterium]|nr:VWA domain-containing protein [Pyrinomonadaceae bacterium]